MSCVLHTCTAIWYVPNCRIFEYYEVFILIFFFNIQNWDSKQSRDGCLKINKYYIIFEISNFEISSNLTIPNFLMTCQQHKNCSGLMYQIYFKKNIESFFSTYMYLGRQIFQFSLPNFSQTNYIELEDSLFVLYSKNFKRLK